MQRVLIGAVIILAGALAVVVVQNDAHTHALRDEVAQQQVQLSDYEGIIATLNEQLDAHKEFIRVLREQSNQSAYSLSNIEAMVATATQTIGDIKKLEEADKELLAKYSKVYFLNEHYTPAALAALPSAYTLNEKDITLLSDVTSFAIAMLNAMEESGLSPKVASGYRSFEYQEDLKHRNAVTYGAGTANQFVADQGYSEHQLGTTMDMSTPRGELVGFEKTNEYTWLTQHAHEYGFTLSYPENNTYYAYEPWHWRFVGVALATKLHNDGVYFYDIPQRDIDGYRLKMFDR